MGFDRSAPRARPAHLAPRPSRRPWLRIGAGAGAVLVLGSGTVLAIGRDDDPRCDRAVREAQEVQAFWDLADDHGLSHAQLTQANVALHTADQVAERCGATAALAANTSTTTTAPPAPPAADDAPEAMWHADADADTDEGTHTRFWTKEVASEDMSNLGVVDDPTGQFGKVYRARLTPAEIEDGFERAEFSQALLGDGRTKLRLGTDDTPMGPTRNIWFGWRSLFGRDVAIDEDNGNDGNYMQLKGDSTCGGPAVGLTIKYGRLALRSEQHLDEYDHAAWTGPEMASLLGSWHSFVVHVELSRDPSEGYAELWLDGQRQTMSDGNGRIYFSTMCPDDDYVYPKLGVYSMDRAIGSGPQHWFESPRIGRSYDAVVPR